MIEKFDPTGGGAERSTAQIVGELIKRGHEVTVLAASAGGDLTSTHTGDQLRAGVSVKNFGGPCVIKALGCRLNAAGMLEFSKWTAQQQRDGRFDSGLSVTTAAAAPVVQPRSGTTRETLDRNIAMRKSAFARAVKRVLIAITPKQRALLALERKIIASLVSGTPYEGVQVRKIAAVSAYVAEQLTRHYKVDSKFVEVIPNAAEMPRATLAERAQWRADVRSGFHIDENETVFLFAALNPKLKGAQTLLEAIALLQARGVKVTALLAGEASWWLQSTADRLGVRESVKLLGPTREMARLYCAADVTVLPSFYDPSSKVIIESLMMGVPGISTAFNGASDFLRATNSTPARGRVIADPGSATELATAMESLINPAERAQCAAACAGLADELSMSRHVDRLERLLESARNPA